MGLIVREPGEDGKFSMNLEGFSEDISYYFKSLKKVSVFWTMMEYREEVKKPSQSGTSCSEVPKNPKGTDSYRDLWVSFSVVSR
jgi:hypothetical protein